MESEREVRDHRQPLTTDQVRDTGLAMVLLALLGAWFTRRWGFVALALVLHLACMIRPALFRPLTRPWFEFSRRLGTLSSTIILSALYFLVVTPVGVARRLLGADPMQLRRWKDGEGTLLRVREHLCRPKDLEKPF